MRKLKPRFVSSTAVFCCVLACASSQAEPAGENLLFLGAQNTAGLTAQDRQAIFAQFNFTVGADGNSLVFADSECPPLLAGSGDIQVATEELNGDGQPEVFVSLGSACMYGSAGTGVSLFTRDDSGQWKWHDLGAGMYAVQQTRHEGYADILVGGPGFCHPVMRWEAGTYVFDRHVAEQPGGCDGQ